MRTNFIFTLLLSLFIPFVNACAQTPYNKLDRTTFNRVAQEINVPLFWRSGDTQSDTITPNELAYFVGLRPDKTLTDYVNNGKFTAEFDRVYNQMIQQSKAPRPDPDSIQDKEQKRRALVLKELGQARPTLVESDFRSATAEDKMIVKSILNLNSLMEEIYLQQNGVAGWENKIPQDDTASKTMFFRNQGPYCLNPATESNVDCNAIPEKPKRVVGVYPASLQNDKNFCEVLQKQSNADELTQPFVSVVQQDNHLTTMPFSQAYQERMQKISLALSTLANTIKNPAESAFKNYLSAAAKAFADNNWYAADESWSKMNATNSKWFLRIAPDEKYWDPCSLKAGFQMTFAKINEDSVIWQKKLDPLKLEMENMLAALAGPPYQARKVDFHLPDFIDIILNSANARHNTGGTMGESLPNSGPVVEQGRGRTMVMANMILPDDESRVQFMKKSSSLFCKKTQDLVIADRKLTNMTTVLHEASHNLGPAHEYKVNGQVDHEIFGGSMASMLEELKAQTSANYFINWLVTKNMISQQTAHQAYLDNVLWNFGHISKGMYTGTGDPKAYSQLSAIQFGTLIKSGAIQWMPNETAANGTDKGCFEVDLSNYVKTMANLESDVLRIKSTGDKAKADALKSEMVDNNGDLLKLHKIISERVQRSPANTFIYSVSY